MVLEHHFDGMKEELLFFRLVVVSLSQCTHVRANLARFDSLEGIPKDMGRLSMGSLIDRGGLEWVQRGSILMVTPLFAWGGKGIIIRSKEGEIGVRIIQRFLNRSGEIHEPCKPMKGDWMITIMRGWLGGMMESII